MNNHTKKSKGLMVSDDNKNRQIDIQKRLFDVNNEIEEGFIQIEEYCNDLENYKDNPFEVEEQWYRLGGTSATEINKALKNFHTFVYNSLGFICDILNKQNSNTKNICGIIVLLTAAESKLYSQLKELTTIDQEDIKKLQKLENQFIKSLENNEEDKETIRKQFERLIDYTQAVEGVKNKWIRGLEVKINDVYNSIDRNIEEAKTNLESRINDDRKKHEDSINAIKNEVELQINNLKEIKNEVTQHQLKLQGLIDDMPNKMKELCDDQFNTMHQTLSTNQESFQTNLMQTVEDKFKIQDVEINKIKQKSFFDSKVYKIGIGIVAIAALVCSLFL